ncbi:hypothetical protein ACFSWE_08640 [Leucobacter albus]|uniref:Uncharacterized protein n=1 Tax=Leucobacter albus TaxID=272210 RepID=A0ABW3TPY6_9MICO
MYEGRVSVLDVADFAVHLRRGSLVSEWFGGWGAITGLEEAVRRVEYAVIAVNAGKKKPEQPSAPKGLRDAVIAQQKKSHQRAARARALASMQAALHSNTSVDGG